MKTISSTAKNSYLKLISLLSQRKAPKKKIVFLLSFPTTSNIILDFLAPYFKHELVIGYTGNSEKVAQFYKKFGCTSYSLATQKIFSSNIVALTKNADVVLCDNYFAFLSGIIFPKTTAVIQLWHADGAAKLFGLAANYTKMASNADKERYKAVYQRFTHYVIGSKKMKTIFETNYQINDAKFLPFGYLPTDIYFDSELKRQNKKQFVAKFGTKKTLLYAPTYRENYATPLLDFATLSKKLGKEWQLLAHAHPHDKELQARIANSENVVTDFDSLSLQALLQNVDCLISDYSSVPFEYALANPCGKLIYYCPDIERYTETVGLQENFNEGLEKVFITNETNLVNMILDYPYKNLEDFNNIWNTYNTGNAHKQLIGWIENR
ncbi:CDP-glycerol glycerophosphotransferase family protein [uncultured Enterococcus sp.]|uniref:CDP-glycerol glycerophosphotransferase family protein n=1 Tax=uncultured Enterococcus sp. TaxID=167972 RepID=UPI0028038E49|nr:CDP-glycerol glycerophosphotransferase family protein [uncultured Enterococcus sp.]